MDQQTRPLSLVTENLEFTKNTESSNSSENTTPSTKDLLSIIIVNYNTARLLLDCLASIYASDYPWPIEVLVVDNCSSDNSVALVQEQFPLVRVVVAPGNNGYAAANNLGLPYCQGQFVLLLNPDTYLPPSALRNAVEFLKQRPEAGAMGPKLVRADGSLDLACRRSFPSPLVSFYRLSGLSKLFPNSPHFARYNLTYLPETTPTEVDSVCGAFMLIRREALQHVGQLDESFFMYGEDLDLAYRIKENGWTIHYCPHIVVRHYKGEASKQRSAQSIVAFYQAMYIFYSKHYAHQFFFLFNWLVLAAIVIRGAFALCQNIILKRATMA